MQSQLRFLGAAGTVTGSKTLVEYETRRLLVDCGLFQGLKKLRLKNRQPLGVDPHKIDALLLTHAHLDHCGYIPLLVKHGFKGPIHCTEPTSALAEIILKDSAKIQEEEAERANRHGYSRHKPALPLYTIKDAEASLPLFVTHGYEEWVTLDTYAKFQMLNAGHILGSALIELKVEEQTIVFSGDLGRQKPMLLEPPQNIEQTDILILESTYGDRLHSQNDVMAELEEVINSTYAKGGILMIPTFAVERAQELLYILMKLKKAGKLPNIPVYLDSPMGVSVTEVMLDMPEWQHLTEQELQEIDNVAELVTEVSTSKAVVEDRGPKIVLAGSGMISGGRILHYLNSYISEERNTILLVGFQAAGTRGRLIEDGVNEIKFFGSYHPVRAEVKKITSLSAHADQNEIIAWLRKFGRPPREVLLNHGEPQASDALRVKISHELGWNCSVVEPNEVYQF